MQGAHGAAPKLGKSEFHEIDGTAEVFYPVLVVHRQFFTRVNFVLRTRRHFFPYLSSLRVITAALSH